MIKLYNEDCLTKINELIKQGIIVDTIICDPPYNIGFSNCEWDNGFDLSPIIPLFSKIVKPNGNIILFQGWSNVCNTKIEMDKYYTIRNWIVWDRIKGRGAKTNLVSTREDILWYVNGNGNYTYNKIDSNIPKRTGGMGTKNGRVNRALTNVWYDISPIVPWSKERVAHPTQKPVQLMERCVSIWSNENDTILDFCCGSGSTLVACQNLNRNAIGIEIDKGYFNIAEQRLGLVD